MSEPGRDGLQVDIKKKIGDFSLDVRFSCSSNVFALLGPSGCGKSMTLKCIAGIETPDEGVITLNGNILFDSNRGIDLPPQKRHVGYMFQDYALFPNMSVRKNIMAGMGRGIDAARVEQYLEQFKLKEIENMLPMQLSGGQKQRTAMARLMASEPEVILLDEPFSALDEELRDEMLQQMKEYIADAKIPVVFVSHSRDEVRRLSSCVGYMSGGCLTKEEAVYREAEADSVVNRGSENMSEFTHFDENGSAVMVDVHEKGDTYRVARAGGEIYVNQECYAAIKGHSVKKGDVLGVARIAGIMAAKKNAELIPLCHILPLTSCKISFELDDEAGKITAVCETSCVGKTGVEMEALTGVSVALLTIYDMCKAIDKTMHIENIRLLEKLGGKSGHFVNKI